MCDNENTSIDIKKKKGRPRKIEQPVTDTQNTEQKKKRGRKKKEPVVEEVKQKKKRGRKAAVKFFSSSIRKQIPLTTVIQDNDNFILHLEVKEDEKQNESDDLKLLTYQEGDLKRDVLMEIKNDQNDNETLDVLTDQSLADFIDNEENELLELYEERIKCRNDQDKLSVKHILTKTHVNSEDRIPDKPNECEHSKSEGFFKILQPFIQNEEWLHHTNVSCWWCCHTFNSIPLGLPMYYDESKYKFRVKGVYCSFACILAYINDYKLERYNPLVKLLYAKITGTQVTKKQIIQAPPRCSLQMFGGKMTIDEFRSLANEDKIAKMVEYPMFVSRDYIEEIDIKNVKNANVKLFNDTMHHYNVKTLDNQRIEDAKLRLQTQINATTITGSNTIDKFIKIS